MPYRHSDEARRKISAANKGNVPWNKGRRHSEETKRKIAAATKMAMKSPQVREKLRAQATGRKHSEETKRKIRNSSRFLHGNASGAAPRRPRNPVPFRFSRDLVAALDSRITKRYREEFIDGPNGSHTGRLRRPMSESTKKKLSSRIKEMWTSPDYRERVLNGIEAHNKKRDSNPLSEAHKEAIRQTLLKRHAALRKTSGTESAAPRRRPRSSLSRLDPTEGTRFSERNMSAESLREKEKRRLRTTQILFEAEEKENETFEEAEAEEAAVRRREEQDLHETNKLLLESLAMAGQLPSLDEEEGPTFGNGFELGGASTSGNGSGFFGFGHGVTKDSPFMGNGLNIEPPGPMKDPLLCSPESSFLSRSLTTIQPNFNDIFIGAEEQIMDTSNFSFTASPAVRTRTVVGARKDVKLQENLHDDDAFEIPFTESVPLGQRLMYGEQEEAEAVDGEMDEDEEDVVDTNEEDELSIAETNAFVPSPRLTESLGSTGDMDSTGSSENAHELEDVAASRSSLLQCAAPKGRSKRIVTYVNGKRVLQSSSYV